MLNNIDDVDNRINGSSWLKPHSRNYGSVSTFKILLLMSFAGSHFVVNKLNNNRHHALTTWSLVPLNQQEFQLQRSLLDSPGRTVSDRMVWHSSCGRAESQCVGMTRWFVLFWLSPFIHIIFVSHRSCGKCALFLSSACRFKTTRDYAM